MAIDAEDRLKGYQTSSPMRDFELKFFAPFKDRRKAETFAHSECKKLGVEQNGEWFKMSVDTAKKIIGDLHGAS